VRQTWFIWWVVVKKQKPPITWWLTTVSWADADLQCRLLIIISIIKILANLFFKSVWGL
jgi:hypothetical protein